jgi:hypothetical protein
MTIRHTTLSACAALLLALASTAPLAHEGHDHGGAPATAEAGAPQRLADGAILLPKASQRQLGLRTEPVAKASAGRAIELPGLVAMDPNAGGRVQALVAGRLEPGPQGFPALGQAVVRGQVLATVRPSLAPADRAALGAQLAEVRAMHALALKRAERLRGLADSVPRKEIEAAEAEVASLSGRLAALQAAGGAEALVAPVAGVIASSRAVAGQVVDARELVFEIVDPRRLVVEATAPGGSLAGADIASASIAVVGRAVPLDFAGAGRSLREQALPLQFRARGPALAQLAVGQPVAVTVQLKAQAEGVPVPAAALVRSSANEPLVWVKAAPERFEPRRVRTQPLDAARVLVTSGLAGGERVVTDGAPLLNQVR